MSFSFTLVVQRGLVIVRKQAKRDTGRNTVLLRKFSAPSVQRLLRLASLQLLFVVHHVFAHPCSNLLKDRQELCKAVRSVADTMHGHKFRAVGEDEAV